MTTIAMPYSSKVSRNSKMKLSFRERKAQFGDGYAQIVPDGLNNVYETWDITWEPLTQTEKESLRTALASIGTWGTILWTPCDETVQKKFRLTAEVSFGRINNTLYSASTTLQQIFDL